MATDTPIGVMIRLKYRTRVSDNTIHGVVTDIDDKYILFNDVYQNDLLIRREDIIKSDIINKL